MIRACIKTFALVVVALWFARSSSAAWTKKNDQTGTATATTAAATAFSSALTNPSIIIVYGNALNTGTLSVTDTAGNSYTDCIGGVTLTPVLYNTSADQLECFATVNTHTTASNVVTLHDSSSTTLRVVAQEWTGGNIPSFKATAANGSTGTGGGQNVSSGSVTTRWADLCIGMAAAQTGTLTANTGGGFTAGAFAGMESLAQGSGGAQAATWSDNTNSDSYAAIEVTFNPTGGTFTAAASTDWNTGSTWGGSGTTCHTQVPCGTDANGPGDNVVIGAFHVTCTGASEVCSAGGSPLNNQLGSPAILSNSTSTSAGGLEVGATATFVYMGNISFTGGTFQVDNNGSSGGTLQHDSSWSGTSTTAEYWMNVDQASGTSTAVWALNGNSTGTPLITLDGDTNDDSYTCQGGAACKMVGTSCTAGTCDSGGVELGNLTFPNNQNDGTWTGVLFEHQRGTGIFSALAPMAFSGSISSGSLTHTNITYKDDYLVTVTTVTGFSGNMTFNGNQFSNTAATSGYGEFNTANDQVGACSGTVLVENSVYDWEVGVGQVSSSSCYTYRNLFFWVDQVDHTTGSCLSNGHPAFDLYDEIFCYHNDSSAESEPIVEPHSTRNVNWIERNFNTSETNVFLTVGALVGTGQSTLTFTESNNVFGGMASTAATNSQDREFDNSGKTATADVNYAMNGNVWLCGYNGKSVINISKVGQTLGSASFPLNVTHNNNTSCASGSTTSDTHGYGNILFNTGVSVTAGTFSTVQNNIFWRGDAGGYIAEVCAGGASPQAGAITTLSNNAIWNTNNSTQSQQVCSNSTSIPSSGPTSDNINTSRAPHFVEQRSVPFFDSEYLSPAGLLPITGTCASPGTYNGTAYTAWATSTSYTAGQIVCDSQGTVFGGKTTFWQCLVNHTSSSTNRPATGISGSFGGYNADWELAYLPWMRTAVLAGTTYQDGALVFATGESPSQSMHAVGLLNAWIRAGYVTEEPTLWQGCASSAECGALQLTAIQHIPPPAMVN